MKAKKSHNPSASASPDKLTLAVNHAMSIERARMGLLAPSMGIDAKRSRAWCEYGFKEDLGFQDFYNLYARGGLAHGAIAKIINKCWQTNPWLIEGDAQDAAKDETAWERKLKSIMRGGRLWRAFKEADTRRLVGGYAGILIQVRDGGAWSDPVKRRGAEIVKIIPTWASTIKPIKYDEDKNSETFGDVILWEFKEGGINGQPGRDLKVHPDRLFVLGDWSGDSIPFLQPAYNAFVSLEKVEGGSGESFLKNAARQLAMNFSENVDLANIASMYGVDIDALHEKFNDAARDINAANDVLLITQGATTTPLVAPVADPTPTYNVNLQTAAAAIDIPSKVWVGMQSGERASSEDQKYFNARCQSRRGELSYDIHDFFSHLMRVKLVDSVTEFAVMWDDLAEATLGDKLESAKAMSEVNALALATGGMAFSNDEIREAAGYDPLEDEGGSELDDLDIDDPAE